MTESADHAEERVGLLGQALDRLGAALERALPEAIGRVLEDLGQSAINEPDVRERQGLQTVSAILRAEARWRAQTAAKALRERADKCLEYTRHARDEDQALALIEEEELQQQLFAAEVARAARHACTADYATYSGRIRSLLPRLWESDELNPAGSRTVAAAAVTAFAHLGVAGRAAVVLRESLARHLPAPVARVIDEVDAWLRERGVRPMSPADAEMPAEPEVASAPAAASSRPREGAPPSPVRPPSAPPPPAADAGVRSIDATAQTADAARKLGRSAFANDPGRAPLQVLATLQPVVEIERDAVAFAHSIDSLPYSRESRAGFFGNVRDRLRTAGVPPAQLSVIEVVGAMFDYVIDDRRLPEAAKPLIWRMQQPVVALALLDPAYLGDEPRSLRRLVENLGAIVNAYAEDLTRGSELHRRLETVVRAVEIVAGALQTRSAVMARQVESEYGRAARNVAQLIDRLVNERASLEATPGRRNRRDYRRRPGREREHEATQRLATILGERLDRHEVPESVRDFVLNVWLRHLRTALLRDGEDSAEFKLSLEVVDDLLWTLDGTRERQSRRVLAQKIPPLIRLLAQGLRAIGARDEEFKPFFDELFLIHLRKMQRRGRVSDATEALEDTVLADARTTIRAAGAADAPRTAPAPVAPASTSPASAAPVARSAGDQAGPQQQPAGGPPSAQARGARFPAGQAPSAPPPASADAADAATPADGTSERRLLEVLSSLDLGDLPASPQLVRGNADEVVAGLRRGDWLKITRRDGTSAFVKVAWINARRTVVLMVGHPDRRALSMPVSELRERLASGRASLVR